MKATYLEKLTEIRNTAMTFRGDAALFKIDFTGKAENGKEYDHIIVSQVDTWMTHLTTIFASDKYGEILDWLGLEGSRYEESIGINQTLLDAGYEVDWKGNVPSWAERED